MFKSKDLALRVAGLEKIAGHASPSVEEHAGLEAVRIEAVGVLDRTCDWLFGQAAWPDLPQGMLKAMEFLAEWAKDDKQAESSFADFRTICKARVMHDRVQACRKSYAADEVVVELGPDLLDLIATFSMCKEKADADGERVQKVSVEMLKSGVAFLAEVKDKISSTS